MKSALSCFIAAAALLLGGCTGRGDAPAETHAHDEASADAGHDAGEAARLAAVLPAPKRHSPQPPSPHVVQRSAWIQRQMQLLGPDHLEGVVP